MKNTIKYADIIKRNPCYDLIAIGMHRDYEAGVVEFIKEYRSKVKDKRDILWVVLRNEYMTKIEFIEFGLFSANRVKHLMKDVRPLNALRVLELYLKDEATEEELKTASDAAYAAALAANAAAYAAANAAACAAAYAAKAAANSAANAADAAAYAADAAANAAAYAAAYAAYAAAYAANVAADATAYAAASAAHAAANAAAYAAAELHETNAQIDKLIEIFEKRKTL